METNQLDPSGQTLEWMLTGYWEFLEPGAVLAGIAPETACRTMENAPYTIARIVAHMHWWQQRRIAITLGEEPADFALQADDWPAVVPEEWDGLVRDFLAGIRKIIELSTDREKLQRIVFGDRTVESMLLSHACHNAYHLGQVVLLRRLLGIWAPPAE